MPREAKIGATKGSYVYHLRVPDPLRQEWDAYCSKRDKKAAPYLRALMRFLIQDEMPSELREYLRREVEDQKDQGPKERVEVRFKPSEYQALLDYADKEGATPQQWIVSAVRASLTNSPEFTMQVLKGLQESTYQITAIGRNLNQIARRMNEAHLAGAPVDPPTQEQIQEVADVVYSHMQKVGEVINASLTRWRIAPDEKH